jgi:hypothetical protein
MKKPPLRRFRVLHTEVWVKTKIIEAPTAEEAKALWDKVHTESFEFSHTVDAFADPEPV